MCIYVTVNRTENIFLIISPKIDNVDIFYKITEVKTNSIIT